MWFSKKNAAQSAQTGVPRPPWENIDTVPKLKHESSTFRLNLTEFVMNITGFGPLGTKLFLFGFGLSMMFMAYIFYISSQEAPTRPPNINRPATDALPAAAPLFGATTTQP